MSTGAMYALKVATRGEREIVMTRMFDAPRRLVFDAWTKPDLLKRWFGGPRGWSLVECDIDLRPGGKYRFLTRHLDGRDMGWGGTYKEVIAPERVVFTEAFDQKWYAGESLITQQMTEEGPTRGWLPVSCSATPRPRGTRCSGRLWSPVSPRATAGWTNSSRRNWPRTDA